MNPGVRRGLGVGGGPNGVKGVKHYQIRTVLIKTKILINSKKKAQSEKAVNASNPLVTSIAHLLPFHDEI